MLAEAGGDDEDGALRSRRGCGPGQSQIDRCGSAAGDGVANAGVSPGACAMPARPFARPDANELAGELGAGGSGSGGALAAGDSTAPEVVSAISITASSGTSSSSRAEDSAGCPSWPR